MHTKLAIITTHPIQYNAPFFKMLVERNNISIKVFYTWSQTKEQQKYDPGFGKNIEWDIPLLDGYEYSFVPNVSTAPGSHHFKGINNPTLKNEINAWGANVVLVYGWAFKSHFNAMRFFKNKIPVLFRGDSTLLNEKKGIKKIIRRVWLKHVYSFVDYALYVGKCNKDYFLSNGLKREKLIFVPHAIDNKRFQPNQITFQNSIQLKYSLKLLPSQQVFLFAGKLDKNKNAVLLINAFQKVKTNDAVLLIVGNGSEQELLKNTFGKHEDIIFLNFFNQLQMPVLYAAADVFILPSKSETWGLTLNEAMAAGKAVIASDACAGAYDVIQHNTNGFIFKNNDEIDLVKYLQHFIDHKTAASEMGKMSLKIISSYSYAADCEALENLCTSIHKN